MKRNDYTGITGIAELRECRRKVSARLTSIEKSCRKNILLALIRSLRVCARTSRFFEINKTEIL